jgi:hypothetical protein
MSAGSQRILAVPVTIVTAGGVAVLVAAIFKGVIFGSAHAAPVALILGGAWAAAMLAASFVLWTGASSRFRGAMWTAAIAVIVGTLAVMADSPARSVAVRVGLALAAVAVALGLVEAGRST